MLANGEIHTLRSHSPAFSPSHLPALPLALEGGCSLTLGVPLSGPPLNPWPWSPCPPASPRSLSEPRDIEPRDQLPWELSKPGLGSDAQVEQWTLQLPVGRREVKPRVSRTGKVSNRSLAACWFCDPEAKDQSLPSYSQERVLSKPRGQNLRLPGGCRLSCFGGATSPLLLTCH